MSATRARPDITAYNVFLAVQRISWRKSRPDMDFEAIHERASELWSLLSEEDRQCFEMRARAMIIQRAQRRITGLGLYFRDRFPECLVGGVEFSEAYAAISQQWEQIHPTWVKIYQWRALRTASCREKGKDETERCLSLWNTWQKRMASWSNLNVESAPELYARLHPSAVSWVTLDEEEQFKFESRVEQFKRGFIRGELSMPSGMVMTCPKCPETFNSEEEFRVHHRCKHVTFCPICLMVFVNAKSLRDHQMQNHIYNHPESGLRCELCHERGRNPKHLLSHLIRDHHVHLGISPDNEIVKQYQAREEIYLRNLHPDRPAVESSSTTGSFVCKDCQSTFQTVARLKYHRSQSHAVLKKQPQCQFCDKSFTTESNLNRHLRKIHLQGETTGPLKSIPCPECGSTFQDRYHLKVHQRKHTGERPFTCSKCKFGFYKRSDLTTHERSCGGIRYSCAKCERKFHFKRQLREHELWSEACGTMKTHIHALGDQPQPSEGAGAPSQPERYMQEKPKIVRLNFSKNQSVVGVNCENLHDQAIFTRKKRKVPCGICERCEMDLDCGACEPCQSERKPAKKSLCVERKCLSFIEQYDVVKDRQKQVAKDLGLNLQECLKELNEPVATFEFVLDEEELTGAPGEMLEGFFVENEVESRIVYLTHPETDQLVYPHGIPTVEGADQDLPSVDPMIVISEEIIEA
eukprot:snap_masked-scaffold1099_size62903-processed-gene-0.11 protein:Tk01136 transcript:snap_masked-scaffold1099_size62903-processed-gene-0.11-mRNA-1 annotation:"zinc finger protein 883-like"